MILILSGIIVLSVLATAGAQVVHNRHRRVALNLKLINRPQFHRSSTTTTMVVQEIDMVEALLMNIKITMMNYPDNCAWLPSRTNWRRKNACIDVISFSPPTTHSSNHPLQVMNSVLGVAMVMVGFGVAVHAIFLLRVVATMPS